MSTFVVTSLQPETMHIEIVYVTQDKAEAISEMAKYVDRIAGVNDSVKRSYPSCHITFMDDNTVTLKVTTHEYI